MSTRAALPVLLVALVAAACNAVTITTGPSAAPSSSAAASAGPTGPGVSQAPGESASPSGSSEPSPVESVAPSAGPSADASASPDASGSPTPAAACAGNDQNRDFFATFAGSVTWDVYCPVLPAGWYVVSGSYRLAGIGRLEITYRGPGDVRLVVQEGGFCTDGASVCAPADSSIGPADFGDRVGELVNLGNDLVLYVDPGTEPAWQATGIGIDETNFRSICAAFSKVPQPTPAPSA
jgi:hypothetical protein